MNDAWKQYSEEHSWSDAFRFARALWACFVTSILKFLTVERSLKSCQLLREFGDCYMLLCFAIASHDISWLLPIIIEQSAFSDRSLQPFYRSTKLYFK